MLNKQEVKGNFYNHKLEEGECWVNEDGGNYVTRKKKLTKITTEELEAMGYEYED